MVETKDGRVEVAYVVDEDSGGFTTILHEADFAMEKIHVEDIIARTVCRISNRRWWDDSIIELTRRPALSPRLQFDRHTRIQSTIGPLAPLKLEHPRCPTACSTHRQLPLPNNPRSQRGPHGSGLVGPWLIALFSAARRYRMPTGLLDSLPVPSQARSSCSDGVLAQDISQSAAALFASACSTLDTPAITELTAG